MTATQEKILLLPRISKRGCGYSDFSIFFCSNIGSRALEAEKTKTAANGNYDVSVRLSNKVKRKKCAAG